MEHMAIISLLPSENCTLKMPAKSFFRWVWMTAGFFDWPRISSKSSSPMNEVGDAQQREDARVVADRLHDRGELVIDALEARLLVGHGATRKDGLEVDPLALDWVELGEHLVEKSQLGLVLVDLIGKGAEEVRRRGAVVVDRHLLDRLAQRNLAGGPGVELLDLLPVLEQLGRAAKEVGEAQLVERHLLNLELAEESRPMLRLEGVAAHILEQRAEVLVIVELGAQVVGDGAPWTRLRLLLPCDDEVVEDVGALAKGDPVLGRELLELGHVLLEERARGHVRLEVGLDVLQPGELRRRDVEVLAVARQLVARIYHLVELGLPLLDSADERHHLLRLGRVKLLGLELEPAR
eukprot:scaffold5708_cov107-Isochrysis_galbana.AAC.12